MVAGLAAGTLAFAPATWLAAGVSRATQGHLLLAEARGTVWSGSAVAVLTDGQDSRNAMALPDRLHWQLGLSGLGLELRLRQACCLEGEPRLRLSGGPGRWQVELRPGPAPSTQQRATAAASQAAGDTSPSDALPADTPPGGESIANRIGQFPAAWLAGLGTPWNTMQLEGNLALTSPGLTLASAEGRWRLSGSVVLDVQHLSSRLSTLPELGTYRLGVIAQEPSPRLSLVTLDGALRIAGTGEWLATGLRFRGEASAAAGSEAVLANLLNIIGRRQGARSLIAIG
jgi:general secretion pathway protein N